MPSAGCSLTWDLEFGTEMGAKGPRCGPGSDLGSLISDIVKRVVTVKLGSAVVPGDGGRWLDPGMGMRRKTPGREPRRSEGLCLGSQAAVR